MTADPRDQRIRELEARNARLRAENAELRRRVAELCAATGKFFELLDDGAPQETPES